MKSYLVGSFFLQFVKLENNADFSIKNKFDKILNCNFPYKILNFQFIVFILMYSIFYNVTSNINSFLTKLHKSNQKLISICSYIKYIVLLPAIEHYFQHSSIPFVFQIILNHPLIWKQQS